MKTLCKSTLLVSLFLAMVLLGACSVIAPPEPTPTPVPPTATATATPTPTPTPTPEPVAIWVTATLPEPMRSELLAISTLLGRPVVWVDDPALAQVRVENNPELELMRRVFAVVAPFPTLTDDIRRDELVSLWQAASGYSFMMTAGTALELQAVFGPAVHGGFEIVEGNGMVDRAWVIDQWAIVPFDQLVPEWKVLTVDGISPVHPGYDESAYALSVTYGLSGDPQLIASLQEQLNWPVSNRDPEKLTVVVMTGVTALTRATAAKMDNFGMDYPGLLIADWLLDADFTHTSNEVSFSEDCPPPDAYSTSLRFCSSPRHLDLLLNLDIDIIELTGNHVNDFTTAPLAYTLELFKQHDLLYFGGGANLEDALSPLLIEHHGNKLAFLGCNPAGAWWAWATADQPGAAPCDYDRLLAEVTRLRAEGYLPIFTFQWWEGNPPTPLPSQVEDFRRPMDAGAIIVQGSQAHMPQGFEFYGDGLIHYGPGNLFFDQMWSLDTRREFIDRHIFYDGRYVSTVLHTAMLEFFAQPRPMTAAERSQFLTEMFRASRW